MKQEAGPAPIHEPVDRDGRELTSSRLLGPLADARLASLAMRARNAQTFRLHCRGRALAEDQRALQVYRHGRASPDDWPGREARAPRGDRLHGRASRTAARPRGASVLDRRGRRPRAYASGGRPAPRPDRPDDEGSGWASSRQSARRRSPSRSKTLASRPSIGGNGKALGRAGGKSRKSHAA